MVPGLFLRQVRETSLANSSSEVLLCQYLNIYQNLTMSLATVVYMSGDTCVNNPAPPLIMETMEGTIASTAAVNLTILLSDDTRSDILGAFTMDPTEDTFMRLERSIKCCVLLIESKAGGQSIIVVEV